MADAVVATAESAPANPTQIIETLTSEQRAEWLESGKLPETEAAKTEETVETKPKTEESATSQEAESAPPAEKTEEKTEVKTEIVPESGTGKDAQKGTPKLKTAEDTDRRFKQLLGDRKKAEERAAELETELDALKKAGGSSKAAESPAAETQETTTEEKKQSEPVAPMRPVRPEDPDEETFEGDYDKYRAAVRKIDRDFTDAILKYAEDLAEYKANLSIQNDRKAQEKARTDSEIEAQNREFQESWRERVDAAKLNHDDFEKVALKQAIPVNATMDHLLLTWDNGAELLYALGKDLKEAQRIAALSPGKTAWEMAKLARTLEAPAVEAKTEEKAEEKTEKVTEKTTPSLKKQTSAPNPPAKVGGTAAVPDDPEARALAAGDFSTYAKLKNTREFAGKKK